MGHYAGTVSCRCMIKPIRAAESSVEMKKFSTHALYGIYLQREGNSHIFSDSYNNCLVLWCTAI